MREALIEVRDHTKDSVIKVEAQSLSEEVGSYRFAIYSVFLAFPRFLKTTGKSSVSIGTVAMRKLVIFK